MDSFPDHFAYRCLPINIANMHAWEILCPMGVKAYWNGGRQKTDIAVTPEAAWTDFAISHFGGGILTFQVGFLFRTTPNYNLLVTGPINAPKDGITPLTAVVEADWAPYSFTMNWMFTRSDTAVDFREGEPFCAFFPIPRGLLDATEPEIRSLASDCELQNMHQAWCSSRGEFLEHLAVPETDEWEAKWQKHYFRGLNPDGTQGVKEHETKLRLKPFSDCREDKRGGTRCKES